MLTKEQIVSAPRTSETFKAWGGEVRISELSGTDLMAYEAGVQEEEKFAQNCARLLCFALVDAEGQRIFGDDDAHLLLAKDAQTLTRLGVAAMRINTMRMQDLEAAEKK